MTFSIVARCAESGRLGVAVATASLAVGGRCPFAASGIGAVTTQSRTQPLLGARVLDLLRDGVSAAEAVPAAGRADAHAEWRQIAAVDARGEIGTFHGGRVGGIHAEARGEAVVALGNLLQSEAVPAAMIAGFMAGAGDGVLEDRLIAALMAGLAAGGETRPLCSAALLVVDRDAFAATNLRVDWDEVSPLAQLAVLWDRWRPVAPTYRAWAIDPGSV